MRSIVRLFGIFLIVMGTAGAALALDQPDIKEGSGHHRDGKKEKDKEKEKDKDKDKNKGKNKPHKGPRRSDDPQPPRGVPEIDPAATLSGLALLSGVLLVVRGDRRI